MRGTPAAEPVAARESRAAQERPGSWWIDVLVFAFVLALVAVAVWFGKRSTAGYSRTVEIDLSWTALPGYALQSFVRGLIAYLLSLVFTLGYGMLAAKNRHAERVLVPLLDVLQGIPVLGFLPALVLGMISLFPGSNLGLELACVLMIFTGQAWNMTFAFYGSLRAIPTELVEVSRVYRSSWWTRFTRLELPSSAIGLIWNSMVSMAGGWFFLMINEAFQLNQKDYRLAGLGSYMSVAYARGDRGAIVGAVVAMVVVIVASDQLLWRPLVVWSQKFRLEEIAAQDRPRSWVFSLLQRSRWFGAKRPPPSAAPRGVATAAAPREVQRESPPRSAVAAKAIAAFGWTVAVAFGGLSLYGAWRLLGLLSSVSVGRWGEITAALGLTTLRTIAALAIASLWAVPLGVVIGLSPRISRRALAVVQVLASFPAPMLFPLLTGLIVKTLHVPFGWGCTFLTLFGEQWYVLFNVIAGAMSIPTDLREVALVYRSSGLGRWRKLILPGIFPFLLTGLITAAGGAWNAAIVTEYQHLGDELVTARGLGSLISQATDAGDYATLAAAVLALTITLVFLNRVVWKRLYRWSDERFAFNR